MTKRILIVNKFYYVRGGAEVVAINLESELKARGYEVGVFTMDFKENLTTTNLYKSEEVSFKHGALGKVKFALRTLGDYGVPSSFERALNEFKPDIVHLHNVHSYLSPIVGEIAKKHGCKVVWTLHDYKLLCPAYSCLCRGEICERCYSAKRNVVLKKCMKNSFSASILAYLEAKRWNRKRLERNTDIFVCPSSFIASKMESGGFDSRKLKVICNFIDPDKLSILNANKGSHSGEYYLYVGRLSTEKGVETLLEVASKLPYKLKIAGAGPLRTELESKYASENIEFLGQQNAIQVSELLSDAIFSVVPSEWYENNPLSVIEALCAGTPVLGARMGGIPELINDKSGILFDSGNKNQLKDGIEYIMNHRNSYDNDLIATTSKDRFSAENHLRKLIDIYES